jgi:hypothetical protein
MTKRRRRVCQEKDIYPNPLQFALVFLSPLPPPNPTSKVLEERKRYSHPYLRKTEEGAVSIAH